MLQERIERAPGTPLYAMAEVAEGADAPNSTATPYTIAVDDRFDGTITAGDTDRVLINLTAGETYVFTVFGRDGGSLGLWEPVLQVFNPAGTSVAYNDGIQPSFGNHFSGVTFTAATTGTYSIAVSGFSGDTGRYTLQTADDVYSVDQVVSQLTEFFWGIPIPIAYDVAPGGTITFNVNGLTSAGKQLARWAFEAWEYASGIDFVEVSGGAKITLDDNQAGAFGGPDSIFYSTGEITLSSVNVSSGWLTSYGTQVNSYSFLTYIHEIGHALGLGHAGPYDGAADYGIDNLYANDSYQMTVMSYFDMLDNTALPGSDWIPITPMIADIAAMQALHGIPASINGGDTVWGANSTLTGYLGTAMGILFDGDTPSSSFWAPDTFLYAYGIGFTIHDTGGTDLFDLSTQTAGQRVDLTPGEESDVGGEIGNVVIMTGTIIEEVITGSGNDTVTGNSAANVIETQGGNDTVDGAGGSDTFVLDVNRSTVTVTAITDGVRIVSALGTDTVTNVESFRFLDQTVSLATLLGPTGPQPIEGDPDPNVLNGSPGDDTIYGYGGSDTILGNARNDLIYGGFQQDAVNGGGGNDAIYGEQGADSIGGAAGNDTLYGGAGNDLLNGQWGDDELWGGTGADTFQFNGTLGTDSGIDWLMDFENGIDKIRFAGVLGSTRPEQFAALTITEEDGNAVIIYNQQQVVFFGIDQTALDLSDFRFG